jgi:2-iminobutanoate/2-iminopropanoate deaminase
MGILAAVFASACAPSARSVVTTDRAPKAIGPYSQAIDCGDTVYCSGQIPIDPATGEVSGATIEEQAELVLKNLQAVLEARGLTLGHVVKTTVYLTDLGEFQRMNQVYARRFGSCPPARATVQVAALPRGVKIEIEAIARRP